MTTILEAFQVLIDASPDRERLMELMREKCIVCDVAWGDHTLPRELAPDPDPAKQLKHSSELMALAARLLEAINSRFAGKVAGAAVAIKEMADGERL